MDYFEARELLRHAGTRQIMPRKKVANNTYARLELEEGSELELEDYGADVVIRLHNTDIIRFRADGTVTFDTGGWLTVTTKERMNTFGAPFRFSANRGVWTVTALELKEYTRADGSSYSSLAYSETMPAVTYRDGITLRPADPRGSLELELLTPEAREATELLERDKETKKRIARYARGITAPMILELLTRAQSEGIGGDCWFCSMFDPAGASSDTDHLSSHLEESYYMVSLMRNALEESGYRDPVFILNVESRGGSAPTMVRRAVRRYLEARLLVGASSGRRGPSALSTGFAR